MNALPLINYMVSMMNVNEDTILNFGNYLEIVSILYQY